MDTPRWSWQPWSALDADAVYAVLALRAQVFVVEQAAPPRSRRPRRPGLAPAGPATGEGTLVAYLRAFPPGALHPEAAVFGRVVTRPPHRGAGLGTALMREGCGGWGSRSAPAPCAPQPRPTSPPGTAASGSRWTAPGTTKTASPRAHPGPASAWDFRFFFLISMT
ncbi:MAG: GNAT family N-acetyltransferase [bacterium]